MFGAIACLFACSDDAGIDRQPPVGDAGFADVGATDMSDLADVGDVEDLGTIDAELPVPDAQMDAADSSGDTGAIDEIMICRADCAVADPDIAAQVDCDYDGLSNADEFQLGTDPCDNDSDRDGLSDLEELRLGTDPNDSDTDGDGVDDQTEVRLRLDPTKASTDGVQNDGDQWIVSICSPTHPGRLRPAPVNEAVPQTTQWRAAFSITFDFTDISDPATSATRTAGTLDGSVTEVFGFAYTDELPYMGFADTTLPAGVPVVTSQVVPFTMWDRSSGLQADYVVQTSSPMTVAELRNDILMERSGISVTGPSSSTTHSDFYVSVAVVDWDRRSFDRRIVLVAVSPSADFVARERIRFEMRDITNATAIADASDTLDDRCNTQNVADGETLYLSQPPITSSLIVFKNGDFIPRSTQNGWDYDPDNNSIQFYGDAALSASDPRTGRGDDVAVAYNYWWWRSF